MKETGTTHWNSPNTGATNESGFLGLPGGDRDGNGAFFGIGYSGSWWSSTEESAVEAWYWFLGYNNAYLINDSYFSTKIYGYSVRCVRD
jgi:uncharacterized protein (TIGR02145 family)